MSFVHRTLQSGLIWLTLCVALPSEAHGQSCDPCNERWKRRVFLYDCDVRVPRPTEPGQVGAWLHLFFASGGIHSALMNNDRTTNCITPFDGALYPNGDKPVDTLTFGTGHTNLPPSGAVGSGDYILWGRIDSSGSGYRLEVILESAITREGVATGTAFLSDARDAMDRAAQTYTQAIAPINSTIHQWEVQKRNSDPTIAIGVTNEGFTLTPLKQSVSPGEEFDVELRLVDCDGVPLRQRTILLTESQFKGARLNGSVNGTFVSPNGVTDDNGVLRVRFVAGLQQGPAVLRAYFVYKNPPGRDMVIGASATVTVGSAQFWEIHAQYRFEEELIQDTAYVLGGASFTNHRQSSLTGSVTMRALHRARTEYGNLYLEDVVVLSIAGFWRQMSFSKSRADAPPVGMVGASLSSHHHEGIAVSATDEGDVSFLGFSDEGGTEMTLWVAPVFVIYKRWEERHWSPSNPGWRKSEGERIEAGSFPSQYDHGQGGTIVRASDHYSASFSTVDTTLTPDAVDGTARTILRTYLTAVIRPYSPVSRVSQEGDNTPRDFFLHQNFPNPFNPTTTIRYAVAKQTHVVVEVYNILGQLVRTLVDEEQRPAFYELHWNASGFSSGMYFYRLRAGSFVDTKKLLLLK